jgi:hypothetical protein
VQGCLVRMEQLKRYAAKPEEVDEDLMLLGERNWALISRAEDGGALSMELRCEKGLGSGYAQSFTFLVPQLKKKA